MFHVEQKAKMQNDPIRVKCRNKTCNAKPGEPCGWPPFIKPTDAPPLYHAEREADSEG